MEFSIERIVKIELTEEDYNILRAIVLSGSAPNSRFTEEKIAQVRQCILNIQNMLEED